MNQPESIWTITSLILTLMIFSYLIGDNLLFRIATYIFVGVSSAYVTILLINNIILPKLILPLISGDLNSIIFTLPPLLLSLLLFLKLSNRSNAISAIPLAIIVGAGAAVMLTGAILGTLIPQSISTIQINSQNSGFITGIILFIGTLTSILYFQFSSKTDIKITKNQLQWLQILKNIGGGFISISLGAIFAGIILSAILALISRFNFIVDFLTSVF